MAAHVAEDLGKAFGERLVSTLWVCRQVENVPEKNNDDTSDSLSIAILQSSNVINDVLIPQHSDTFSMYALPHNESRTILL